MNTQTLHGNWNVTKGKLKQKYAQLTDNDLAYEEGKEDELVGRIQRRVGASRQEIEDFIDSTHREPNSGAALDRKYGATSTRPDNVDLPLKRDIGSDTRRNVGSGADAINSNQRNATRDTAGTAPQQSGSTDQQRRATHEVDRASGTQLRDEQRTQNQNAQSTARGSSGQSRQAEQQPAARDSNPRTAQPTKSTNTSVNTPGGSQV